MPERAWFLTNLDDRGGIREDLVKVAQVRLWGCPSFLSPLEKFLALMGAAQEGFQEGALPMWASMPNHATQQNKFVGSEFWMLNEPSS